MTLDFRDTNTQKRAGRPPTDPGARREIRRLHRLGWTPADIRAELEATLDTRAPSTKTIRRIVAKLETRGDTTLWTLLSADPDDAELVLPVLMEVIRASEGRKTQLTRGEAEWIARLRRAAPSIPPLEAHALGGDYLAAATNGEPTDVLDAHVAFAPWRDDERAAWWQEAQDKGWVRQRVMRSEDSARVTDTATVTVVSDLMKRATEPRRSGTRNARKGQRNERS